MTTKALLLDASALVELMIDGEHRRGADRILERLEHDPDTILITAAHALTETVSALRRLTFAEALSGPAAETAIGWLGRLDLTLDPAGPRLAMIWSLRDTMTPYDAAYAAAAQALRLPLITADRKRATACQRAGIEARSLDTALDEPPAS